MSKQDPRTEPEAAPDEWLEQRLRLASQRYQLFFRKPSAIVTRILADREESGETSHSSHAIHISDFISVDELDRIVQSSELRNTESWARHMQEVSDIEESELSIGDWPEANVVLDSAKDRRDAAAQLFALNDSFAGFVKLLVSWLNHQDEYSRLFELSRERGLDDTELDLMLAGILEEDVPELLEEDLLSAMTFIRAMISREQDSAD